MLLIAILLIRKFKGGGADSKELRSSEVKINNDHRSQVLSGAIRATRVSYHFTKCDFSKTIIREINFEDNTLKEHKLMSYHVTNPNGLRYLCTRMIYRDFGLQHSLEELESFIEENNINFITNLDENMCIVDMSKYVYYLSNNKIFDL